MLSFRGGVEALKNWASWERFRERYPDSCAKEKSLESSFVLKNLKYSWTKSMQSYHRNGSFESWWFWFWYIYHCFAETHAPHFPPMFGQNMNCHEYWRQNLVNELCVEWIKVVGEIIQIFHICPEGWNIVKIWTKLNSIFDLRVAFSYDYNSI